MTRTGQAVAAAGAAMLVVSFLPWWRATTLGYSETRTAWDLDLVGARLAVLLSVAAAAYVVALAKGVHLRGVSVDPRLPTLLLSAAALVCMLVQLLADQELQDAPDVDVAWQLGAFLALALTVVQTVVAAYALLRGRGPLTGMSP